MSHDLLTLTGLRATGHHGVFDHERRDGRSGRLRWGAAAAVQCKRQHQQRNDEWMAGSAIHTRRVPQSGRAAKFSGQLLDTASVNF